MARVGLAAHCSPTSTNNSDPSNLRGPDRRQVHQPLTPALARALARAGAATQFVVSLTYNISPSSG